MPESKINAAIIDHKSLVVRFNNSIHGITNEKYDTEQVGDDTICAFGRLLYGDAKNILVSKRLEQVVQLHKSFHQVAAKIAAMINRHEIYGTISPLVEDLEWILKQFINMLRSLKSELKQSELS